MRIHREGYRIMGVVFVVLTFLNATVYYSLPEYRNFQLFIFTISMIFFLWTVSFFRSPGRTSILNPNHVLAPADGKVVVIEETEEPEYFKDRRQQVSIFMSPMNVHLNRNPVSGVVKYFRYHKGKYLVAWHPKSSTENERTTIVVENEKKVQVLFRQIAGFLAKRIVWYIEEEGDKVTQGEEFGFIKFGSRVDLFLPLDAKIRVEIGAKTRGGETVIAELIS